jgi:ech hydrogenase subunit F
MSFFPIGKTLIHSLFSKPPTVKLSKLNEHYQERTRGHVVNEIEQCIYCGICSRKCPTNAIVVDRGARTWSINRFDCIQCRSCVDNCPKKCLTMANEQTPVSFEKYVDTIQGPPPAPPKEPVEPAAKPDAPHAEAANA